MASKGDKVAIVGSGLIGQSWAMIFASGGYEVTIFDILPEQNMAHIGEIDKRLRDKNFDTNKSDETVVSVKMRRPQVTTLAKVSKALENVKTNLAKYESQGCLRGKISAADQAQLIKGSSDIQGCLKDAVYVQECVPESVDLKRKVFEQMDPFITENMVVASSSSCLGVSQFAGNLKNKSRTLGAHPINPPYFVPLVEIVPGPWTAKDVVATTRALLEEVGQSPVTLSKEVPGFAVNRIQYSIINECWNMYKDGLLSAADIDKVMVDGLGPRYAFIGPLETMHLNADGIADYCKRYGQGAYNVCQTLIPPPIAYDEETAGKVLTEMGQSIPLDEIPNRRVWRDGRLAALAALKKQLKEKTD